MRKKEKKINRSMVREISFDNTFGIIKKGF